MANAENTASPEGAGETYAGPSRNARPSDRTAIVLVALAWTIAVLLVWPVGNFPLYDDWAYVEGVRNLVDRGEIRFSDWASVNLISLILWGSVFAFPFGDGFEMLRLSTLVAALLGGLCLYRLLRLAGVTPKIGLLATLAVLFHPVSFFFSFSFMTDVPYAAAQTAAMLFLLAGFHSRDARQTAAGWFLALVALLCRQTGLAIPFGYAGAYLAKHGLGARRVAIAALPLAVFAAVQVLYQHWLSVSGKAPTMFGAQYGPASSAWTVARNIPEIALAIVRECGLALLPLSIMAFAAMLASSTRVARWRIAGITAVLAALLWAVPIGEIYRTVIIVRLHSGAGAGVLAAVAGALFIGAVALSVRLAVMHQRARAPLTFCILAIVALSGAHALLGTQYDRYLIPTVPLAAVIVCLGLRGPVPRLAVWIGAVLFMAMAAQSVLKTHNHFATERMRLLAVQDLMRQGVPRENIDAGWMFNGADNFGRFGDKRNLYSWFAVRDYVVDPLPAPGYRVVRRYAVRLWHWRGAEILVQRPE